MMPNPCTRDCPDRRAGTRDSPPCMTDCPRRAAWLAERAELRAARERQRVLDGYAGHSAAQHRAVLQEAAKRHRERTRR